MAFYCLCMLEIALILVEYDAMYEEIAFRFLEQFAWITYAMDRIRVNHDEMWDTEDGFFYDLLHFPNGDAIRRTSLIWRNEEVTGRSALARLRPVLRVLPWRQRRWVGASHQTG